MITFIAGLALGAAFSKFWIALWEMIKVQIAKFKK